MSNHQVPSCYCYGRYSTPMLLLLLLLLELPRWAYLITVTWHYYHYNVTANMFAIVLSWACITQGIVFVSLFCSLATVQCHLVNTTDHCSRTPNTILPSHLTQYHQRNGCRDVERFDERALVAFLPWTHIVRPIAGDFSSAHVPDAQY